jgi:hypothetical protein
MEAGASSLWVKRLYIHACVGNIGIILIFNFSFFQQQDAAELRNFIHAESIIYFSQQS